MARYVASALWKYINNLKINVWHAHFLHSQRLLVINNKLNAPSNSTVAGSDARVVYITRNN